MALVFDVTGSMAMFRKSYTTTSSVSFPFPPPTAVAGLLSAIVGFESGSSLNACRAAFWEKMKGTRIALGILRSGTIGRHTINFWNTKEPKKNPRIQITHQFIFSPKYRVYVAGSIEPLLKPRLENGTFVYTPYLGVAYAIADLLYVGCFDEGALKIGTGVEIDSVIPWRDGMKIDVSASGGAFKERMPFVMDSERALKQVVDVLYSPSPERKLHLMEKGEIHVARCGQDTIAWFPEW